MTDADAAIKEALKLAADYGSTDGAHHKMWLIDQMVRALTMCPMVEVTTKDYKGEEYTYLDYGDSDKYLAWVAAHNDGEEGPDTYHWDEGIAP
jgi:hypothetical protein